MNGTQTTPLTCGTKDNTQTANGNQVNTQAVGTQYKTRNRRNISQSTGSSSQVNHYMYRRHKDTTHGINTIRTTHGIDGTR